MGYMDLSGDHNQLVPRERPGLVKKMQLRRMAWTTMHDEACRASPISGLGGVMVRVLPGVTSDHH